MVKRTILLRANADDCLRAIFSSYLTSNVKANYSSLISDAVEFYFDNVKTLTGKEIHELRTKKENLDNQEVK